MPVLVTGLNGGQEQNSIAATGDIARFLWKCCQWSPSAFPPPLGYVSDLCWDTVAGGREVSFTFHACFGNGGCIHRLIVFIYRWDFFFYPPLQLCLLSHFWQFCNSTNLVTQMDLKDLNFEISAHHYCQAPTESSFSRSQDSITKAALKIPRRKPLTHYLLEGALFRLVVLYARHWPGFGGVRIVPAIFQRS